MVVVDHDRRLRRVLTDALGVAAGHVHRDRAELAGAREDRGLDLAAGLEPGGLNAAAGRDGRAGAERDHDRRLGRRRRRSVHARIGGRRVELGEELIGGGLPLAVAAPDHAAATVIADQRQVAVALSPRDLVDRDLKQLAEPVLADVLVGDTLDDPPDRLPVDPRQPAGRRLVGLGRQPRHEVVEVAREARAVAGERDALDVHAVLRTAQPPQPGADLQAPDPEIQMPPDRVVVLLVLAMARAVRALRALKAATTQRDGHADPIGLKVDRANPDSGQIEQARECARDAHRRRPPVRSFRTANLRSELVRVTHTPPPTPQAAKKPCSATKTRARRSARITYDHPRSPIKGPVSLAMLIGVHANGSGKTTIRSGISARATSTPSRSGNSRKPFLARAYYCRLYAEGTGYDVALARFLEGTGGAVDLNDAGHRALTLQWLRNWGSSKPPA